MAPTILVTGATGLIGFQVLLATLSAGHTVRCTVRSEAKAKTISSNQAIEKLSPGQRLSFAIVPDICTDGAYDVALKGISHVLHVGSPVPVPGRDPNTEVYQPIVKSVKTLLNSCFRTPTIQRVVMTSSIVANMSPDLSANPPTITASTRVQDLKTPSPSPTFAHVFEAYHIGKIIALNTADTFKRTNHPHFSISHVIPGYVFGANPLATSLSKMLNENSSNNILVAFLTGTTLPGPILGGVAHILDVAELHLRVLLGSSPSSSSSSVSGKLPAPDIALASPVIYEDAFGYVQKHFPRAVQEGIFKKGKMETVPVPYEGTRDAERVLGRKLRGFEAAVLEVAGQYLDLLGKERG